jgi:Arc/MetJ-type ribon-helix-helix transcriptional regulator
LKLVTAKIPEAQVTDLDELVRMGMYRSRSAAIRAAVRDLMHHELWRTPADAERVNAGTPVLAHPRGHRRRRAGTAGPHTRRR